MVTINLNALKKDTGAEKLDEKNMSNQVQTDAIALKDPQEKNDTVSIKDEAQGNNFKIELSSLQPAVKEVNVDMKKNQSSQEIVPSESSQNELTNESVSEVKESGGLGIQKKVEETSLNIESISEDKNESEKNNIVSSNNHNISSSQGEIFANYTSDYTTDGKNEPETTGSVNLSEGKTIKYDKKIKIGFVAGFLMFLLTLGVFQLNIFSTASIQNVKDIPNIVQEEVINDEVKGLDETISAEDNQGDDGVSQTDTSTGSGILNIDKNLDSQEIMKLKLKKHFLK